MHTPTPTQYELRFPSLFDSGRAFTFPCNSEGQVDLDGLGDSARESYLYARAVVGRELATPTVLPCTLH